MLHACVLMYLQFLQIVACLLFCLAHVSVSCVFYNGLTVYFTVLHVCFVCLTGAIECDMCDFKWIYSFYDLPHVFFLIYIYRFVFD